MRILIQYFDHVTDRMVDTAVHIHDRRIVWRGQHFFIYKEENYYEEAWYFVTHIGTGRMVFPGAPDIKRLTEIVSDMDTWDIDWGAVRKYGRIARLHGADAEMSPAVQAFASRVKPYWQEVYNMTRHDEHDSLA